MRVSELVSQWVHIPLSWIRFPGPLPITIEKFMINLATKLPNECFIAFSGGSDSSALLHFLTENPKRKVSLVHVIHKDYEYHEKELEYVKNKAKRYDVPLITADHSVGFSHLSKEERWSLSRKEIFNSMPYPVLTGHNLNDALEWHIMTSSRGSMVGKFMPTQNGNVLRPFLYTKKQEIANYINNNNLSYFQDPTNDDVSIVRNRIRHLILPQMELISPGIYTSFLDRLKENH